MAFTVYENTYMGPSLMVHDQNTNNLIILENVPGGEI
jgi:hypothetical protein